MVAEVLARMPAPQLATGAIIADGTLGTGGHSLVFRQAMGGRGTLIGIERDPQMLAKARVRLGADDQDGVRLVLVEGRYEELPAIVEREGLDGVDGVLLDLGVNSLQLDEEERGFAFKHDTALDGRFNPAEPGTRSMGDLVNTATEGELIGWLRAGADEPHAKSIARAIVGARARAAIRTTGELAELVRHAYPPAHRFGRVHPATRTFQALRLVANDELGCVERGVRACASALRPGGVLCVLSYHSGEDRIVKTVFDELGSPRPDPTNPYAATSSVGLAFAVESRGAVKPADEETARNPRARSARLRTLTRLAEVRP